MTPEPGATAVLAAALAAMLPTVLVLVGLVLCLLAAFALTVRLAFQPEQVGTGDEGTGCPPGCAFCDLYGMPGRRASAQG